MARAAGPGAKGRHALVVRNAPSVFTTGYDASAIPERCKHVSRCEKPVRIRRVVEAFGRATHR
jgi:hypothetical protein